jgi:hypothetical protein
MPLKHKIVSDLKFVYIKVSGEITADEIMLEGVRIFTDREWVNGFNILCDYRETTAINLTPSDIRRIIKQDINNVPLFDKSKFAILADKDLIFGFSRMWEILSENNPIKTMVFRNISDSLRWLDMEDHIFQSIKDLP